MQEGVSPAVLSAGALLCPAMVWFGEEPIVETVRERIHAWLDQEARVDLMLVVGISAEVYPRCGVYPHCACVGGDGGGVQYRRAERGGLRESGCQVEGRKFVFKGSVCGGGVAGVFEGGHWGCEGR